MITMITHRGGTKGLHPDGPLRHAVHTATLRPGRTTVDAVCGAQVAVTVSHVFDVLHPRACARCKAALS